MTPVDFTILFISKKTCVHSIDSCFYGFNDECMNLMSFFFNVNTTTGWQAEEDSEHPQNACYQPP